MAEPLSKPPRSTLTIRHMIAAVGVLVLVVLVLGFLSSGAGFTPGGPVADPSRVRTVDAPAQLRGLAGSVTFPVHVPRTPSGWRATSTGVDTVDGHRVVRVGYLTTAGEYIQLQQSDASETALLTSLKGGNQPVPGQGAQDVGGQRWVVYGSRPTEPVWIADATAARLLITGSAPDADFATLATAAH